MKKEIIQILKWLMYLLGHRERVVYKNKVHYIRKTIKRPVNDGTSYVKKENEMIMELNNAGKIDKEIGRRMGRTEGAIRQQRYIIRHEIITKKEVKQ